MIRPRFATLDRPRLLGIFFLLLGAGTAAAEPPAGGDKARPRIDRFEPADSPLLAPTLRNAPSHPTRVEIRNRPSHPVNRRLRLIAPEIATPTPGVAPRPGATAPPPRVRVLRPPRPPDAIRPPSLFDR